MFGISPLACIVRSIGAVLRRGPGVLAFVGCLDRSEFADTGGECLCRYLRMCYDERLCDRCGALCESQWVGRHFLSDERRAGEFCDDAGHRENRL